MEENNNVVSSETNSEEGKVVLEFSTIQNGVEMKQSQVNDEIKPTEEKKKSIIPFIFIVVCLIICVVVFIVVRSSIAAKASLEGKVESDVLTYKDPVKDKKIEFKLKDDFIIEAKITDVEDDEGVVGVTYDLSVKGHKDSISNNVTYLDRGVLNIRYNMIGNSVVFQSNKGDSLGGRIVHIINKDGSITLLKDFDKHSGFIIESADVIDDFLIVKVVRYSSDGILIRYDDRQEDNSETIGLSICESKIHDLDDIAYASEVLTYSLREGVLDLENPQVGSFVTVGDYIALNKFELCQ